MSSESARLRARPTNPFVEFTFAEVEQSIGTRFEQQVARYPERIAVKSASTCLTYAELNRLTNRLAHALLARPATDDQRVGLLLDEDAPLVVALLGVLKAGKVGVPLDKTFPAARAAQILADAETGLVITNARNFAFAQRLAGSTRPLINLDELEAQLPGYNPNVAVPPSALAYIIYTSGSTGQPKGVVQLHHNLLRNVMAFTNGLHLCAEDRLAALASCSTGQGMSTLFCALLNGAALHPFSIREEGVDKLAGWLRNDRITVYISAATVFRHFMHTLSARDRFPDVRLTRLGGESVRKQDVEMYKRHFSPGCLFVSALSATETGNIAQFHLDHQTEIATDNVPVGYAVEGVEMLLLDETGAEVGCDTLGEIAVKSRFLSPGYWRRPDLTEKVFLPVGGEWIYRTGDLGIRRGDGCLEHVGRKDFRVKIRGFGVELEEIENALRRHPGVREAVAGTKEDNFGDARVVAWVVAAANPAPDATALRSFLRQNLPEQMVPAVIVFLDALPMAPNGKVDRRALADLAASEPREPRRGHLPNNPLQFALAAIWQDVLHVEHFGVGDSFFDFGGHSLTATQVLSRVSAACQVDLPLTDFLEHPTIAWLEAQIERKRAATKAVTAPPLAVTPREGDLPLSFSQQRLWFLDQFEPGSAAYNLPWALRLVGDLNSTALEQSLTEIVRRHESLRTVFSAVEGRPVQRILVPEPVPVTVIDLRHLPGPEREAEARRRIDAEARQPFNLPQGPLFRAVRLRLADDEHALMLTMHHIISDRWSKWILTHELGVLYDTFCAGRPSPLPELSLQYADFAQWQRGWLQGAVLDDQLGYWQKQLGGELPVLHLPTDRPRPAVLTSRGAILSTLVPAALTTELKQLSRRKGVTLYMTLLAAFQTLLHRYTGQDDIAVGSPIANRNRVEIERLIGFFVNTLVMRSDLSGDPPFSLLLRRVRQTALGAYAHQDLPFEKLVEELQPQRSPGHSPLFQVGFALQNMPKQALQLAGLTVSTLTAETGTTKFDLCLTLVEDSDKLRAGWEFNTDLFDRSTIVRLSEHFQNLLAGVAAQPNQRLAELPLLSADERRLLLVAWNQTTAPYPQARSLPQLFEAQVERTPDHVAVSCENERLTYRELNRRANQVANRLRRLGVGPDALVGLYLERSLEMIVAIWGVLKAGAAYVPLDPTYPGERLAFMMEDAHLAVLLTTTRLQKSLPGHGAIVACLDQEDGHFDALDDRNPAPATTPENLAYVIYTSGSTGRPKGTLLRHDGVVNLVEWKRREFGDTPAAVVLQFSTFSFDASVWEVFTALLSGARLHLLTEAQRDFETFATVVAECGATEVILPTAYFRQLALHLPEVAASKLAALKWIFVAGENLTKETVAAWQRRFGTRSEIINAYGPTECTVFATVYRVKPGAANNQARETERALAVASAPPLPCLAGIPDTVSGSVPIGRPIANTQIYVLDPHLQPVPIGVAGEVHIAGAGLAAGYLHARELLAECFIANPFSDQPGARLYKTGDRARYLADGNIEFLGRLDRQVKIRGFRVELSEVEAVLAQHPAVRECAIVVHGEESGGGHMVAFFSSNDARTPADGEVRRFLQSKLPDYMIPVRFVAIDRLPQTPSGKLDRRVLQRLDAHSGAAERPVAPCNLTEAVVAEIWAEVLQVEHVGLHDNFFDLGGHSLMALQLFSKLRRAFDTELPVRLLFEAPTVAELVERIAFESQTAAAAANPDWQYLTPIQPLGTKRPLFLVPGGIGGEEEFLVYARLGRYLGLDQPLYGLKAGGFDGRSRRHESVEAMAADYIREIRSLQPPGPYLVAGECLGGIVAFEVAQQLHAQGQKIGCLILLDGLCPGWTEYVAWRWREFRGEFQKSLAARAVYHLGQLWRKPSGGRRRYVKEKVLKAQRRLAGERPVNPLALTIPHYEARRAHYTRTLHRYRPREYPGVVSLIVSEGRRQMHPNLGWKQFAGGGWAVHTVQGNHLSYIREEARTTAEQLRQCLDQAQ